MITFSNGGRLVQDISELPDLKPETLYLDVETDNIVGKKDVIANPFKEDRIAGIAVTADNHAGSWYIPIRHEHAHWNLPLPNVQRWLKDQVGTCKRWINHNVKFDAHFCAADGAMFNGELICTLTLAKIIDSDRVLKGGYGLDAVSADWLDEDISPFDQRIQAYLACLKGPKRYSRVPADIMGEYACQDVITNRKLFANLLRRRDDQTKGVWDTEIKLTPVLFDMEREGMRVNLQELMIQEYMIMNELTQIEEIIHKMTGLIINPANNDDCYELLCVKHQLPVLAYTEEDGNNPSFDKDALKSYLSYPTVAESPDLTQIIKLMLHYRKRNTLLTFFVRPYQMHQVNGVMHPQYNQAVRTARLSCKQPNAQQLSPAAKALVHPDEGGAFLSVDYSQIEFRLIVHYIKDVEAIRAYQENPDTDFHQWVADMCVIPRKPAKNVNFCIAFGGGKNRVISMLASNMDLVGKLGDQVERLIEEGKVQASQRKLVFEGLCQARGKEVFDAYHDTLPGLRVCTRKAYISAKSRGHVFNGYGRQRHLPDKAAWRAFNAVVQSTAADLMKERTVAIAPRYNKTIRDWGITIRASVHDETKFHGEREAMRDPRVVSYIVNTLEDTAVKFRVPIRATAGWSDKDWATASGDSGKLAITR